MSRPVPPWLLAVVALLAVLVGLQVVDGPPDALLAGREVVTFGDGPTRSMRDAAAGGVVRDAEAEAEAEEPERPAADEARHTVTDDAALPATDADDRSERGRRLAALRTAHVDGRVVAPRRPRVVVPALPALAPAELQRRLAQGSAGTYVDELVAARDSLLTRWPDRRTEPIRVFVHDGGTLEGWRAGFAQSVREAFDTWGDAGLPLRFAFVRTRDDADVEVRFITRFPDGMSGKTVWTRDQGGWLVAGEITLAVQQPSGDAVTDAQLHAIALHEVGHLLGLDHVRDARHIMAARVRARTLSDADLATMRLLYSVPAGPLR